MDPNRRRHHDYKARHNERNRSHQDHAKASTPAGDIGNKLNIRLQLAANIQDMNGFNRLTANRRDPAPGRRDWGAQ